MIGRPKLYKATTRSWCLPEFILAETLGVVSPEMVQRGLKTLWCIP